MKKKGLILVVLMVLLSSTVVFAASVNGTFAGLPIVNVKVNNETLKPSVPGIVLQGSTMLPARAVAESLNAVVSWDQTTMTASIEKPDVTMCFVDSIEEMDDESWVISPFGILDVGQDQDVTVYYEVGPMKEKLYEYRIIVKAPNGDIIKSSETDSYEITAYGMVGYLTIDDIDFTKAGNYKFEFQIKYDNAFKSVESKLLVIE
ncbi:stalk domain-containing protein [Sinanaerobacter chloroacetimidivorans]|uniref:GOLD domain-containing protein n=1 Tax=Sinanaerobacter chloroacetimidivorans TaxID=2818044 RepID=A0A8J7W2D7_9FIRM|nr:stalk domain-containing protein [Sinanaerobacter chloroacetimidivorans]MBR0599624.1 hypothetical protein [Sinanaerobacter chloroacetimidivorans]